VKGDNTKVRRSRRYLNDYRQVVCIVSLSVFLSSCGLLQKIGILSPPPDAPLAVEVPVPLSEQSYKLILTLSATDDVNPDSQSRPSPVQVRIFVTDAQSEIAGKRFEEVFDLGDDLVDPRPVATLTLRPGQIRQVILPANKSQNLLAIAAAYRDPFQSIWLTTGNVVPMDSVSATASISAQSVVITSTP